MIGIACSFFTAVYITRVIISWMTKDGKKDNVSFQTPFSKNFLTNINIDFLGKRKIAYVGFCNRNFNWLEFNCHAGLESWESICKADVLTK